MQQPALPQVKGDGTGFQENNVIRHGDPAQTPDQRLVAHGSLSRDQRTHFQALYERTNPMTLRREIAHLLAAWWNQPSSATSVA